MADHERKQSTDTPATLSGIDSPVPPADMYTTVWIACEGGCSEQALLIEEYEEMHFIEWETSGEREFVESHRVSRQKIPSPLQHGIHVPLDMERTALEEDDDDEVQLVLTILPPSPAKPNASQAAMSNQSLAMTGTTDTTTNTSNHEDRERNVSENPSDAPDQTSLDQSITPNRTLWSDEASLQEITNSATSTHYSDDPNEAILTAPGVENNYTIGTLTTDTKSAMVSQPSTHTATLPSPHFSSRTSAYLQSLAEICHAILWDVRWRVGGARQERLLTWERGHDLSAVHALARRYLPLPSPPPISICYCLFCNQDNPSDEPILSNDDPQEADNEEGNSNPPPSTTTIDESPSTITSEDEEAYDRALNLYARLYSRKGPWFRVDDLFKYYAPKRRGEAPGSSSLSKQESPVKPTSPSKFFLPKTSPKPTAAKSADIYIDQEYVNRQLDAVTVLLQDVQQLFRMGLIRSFQSEQECGQTTGQIGKYGLLRQEEQVTVLKKLGGGTRTSPKQQGTNQPKKKVVCGENLLWKQMCQQQSILPKGPDSTPTTVLLPVAKHVDQTLVATWANTLVLRATRVNYIPQSILRVIVGPLQQTLQQLLLHNFNMEGQVSCMCLRLREAPLQTLQRCCRLYLCATSGPGDMRGDTGTNAWKTLPHEIVARHDHDSNQNPFTTNIVAPPHSPNWHHTIIPGRDYRFKLISCAFRRAHQPLLLDQPSPLVQSMTQDEIHKVQVFPSVAAFGLWELSVAFRSIVDYLLEANELALYTERKRAREERETATDAEKVTVDDSQSTTNGVARDAAMDPNLDSPVDFLNILKQPWRKNILHRFSMAMMLTPPMMSTLEDQVESTVRAFLEGEGRTQQLKNDCERVLGVIAILSTNILWIRNQAASEEEIHRVVSRPWLRHLWWEGCLAYLLWDIIPILERRGFYDLATQALEILLFGNYQPRNPSCSTIPLTLVTTTESFLAQAYLSRRARGKAYERLVVDYLHIIRQQQKKGEVKKATPKLKRRRNSSESVPEPLSVNDTTAKLCQELIDSTLPTGQITFCAARTLARRMKQPLSETLGNAQVYEVQELGHRLASNGETEPDHDDAKPAEKKRKCTKKYSDWSPITDQAIANAMMVDGKLTSGTRCSYVGFEDQNESPGNFNSLNVEQLALEYYNSGRLPETAQDSSILRGGWVGWHDEGGKLRALFRILSSMTVLGSDWNCPKDNLETIENATIHLTPYQGAPFDLHVGAEYGTDNGRERLGFYARRKVIIDRFLDKLERLDPIQVAHLVHGSIAARWHYARKTRQTDPTVERDIEQARTLSALAAGFGGKMLSAMCRCLYFDYRHYSGGLPDLTLFRAIYERDESHDEETLVDLGSWLGEEFDPATKAERDAKRIASMLEDREEEFLGCSKVGDSGRRTNRMGGRTAQTSRRLDDLNSKIDLKLPDRLVLQHDGRNVRVECMLVEVKSHNDRLDPRQEDWLNVLDRFGNVRVCKFTAKTKDTKVKAPEPPPPTAT